MGELISVLMPAYNVSGHKGLFHQSVNSILNQSHSDLELIIVDDCSSDNTKSIISEIVEKDGRVKGITLDKNVGPGIARNVAFNICNGEHITCHDADDFSQEDRFEQLLANMPSYGIVTSRVRIKFVDGGKRERVKQYGMPRFDIDLEHLRPKPSIHFSGVLLRSDLYRELGGMENFKFSSDSLMAIKLSYFLLATGQTDEIKSLDDILFQWNRRGDSITMKVKSNQLKTDQRKPLIEFLKKVKSEEIKFPISVDDAKKELDIKDSLNNTDVNWTEL